MMKIITKFLIIFTCALCLSTEVYATSSCPNSVKKELSTKATYVKADYEVIDNSIENEITIGEDKTTYKVPNYTFKISIYNIGEDLKVEVKNTYNDQTFTIRNSDTTDNTYTFEDKDIGNIYNYEIKIISDRSDCSGITLKTLKFTKPRYNAYSEFSVCSNSSSFYCQRFVGTELKIKSTEDFLSKVNAGKKEPMEYEESTISEIKKIFSSKWTIYIGVSIGVIALIIITIIVVKMINKKRRGVL